MITKSVESFDFKNLTERGTFEGWLSTYGNVDDGHDLVVAGAFTKTLQDRGNKVPLLWQHQTDRPIGELFLEDRPEGLWARGQLLMSLDDAKKAYTLLKAGIVTGMSIGFQPVRHYKDPGTEIRVLKEIKLYEGSLVMFPMNEAAMVTSVKSHQTAKRSEILRELKRLRALMKG